MNDAKMLLEVMQGYAGLGQALQRDLYYYVSGSIYVDQLPDYSLKILLNLLKGLAVYDQDGSIKELVDEMENEIIERF